MGDLFLPWWEKRGG